jgi:hypothetical protein
MRFIVSLCTGTVDRSRFFIGAILQQASEDFRPALDAQEVGLQNSLPAAMQACWKGIFRKRVRLVCEVNRDAQSGGVRCADIQVCGRLLRNCIRQATGHRT